MSEDDVAYNTVTIRCYAELNRYLPVAHQCRDFYLAPSKSATVEIVLNMLGIPTAEVDLILVNGEQGNLGQQLQHGDRVTFYPVFESFDIESLQRPHVKPLRSLRFCILPGLEILAECLQKQGFDVTNVPNSETALKESQLQQCVVLTRDPAILQQAEFTRIYAVRETDAYSQWVEVKRRFDLE